MTKQEMIAKITAAIIAVDTAIKNNRLDVRERGNKIKEIYDYYKPDNNVWRKACKDASLKILGYWFP